MVVIIFLLAQQPDEAAVFEQVEAEAVVILADIGQPVAAVLLAQQLDGASSNAASVVLVSAFWAQPATAIARQIPNVAIMVFIGDFLLKEKN